MVVDERETTNGHGCGLNCSMGPMAEATSNDTGGLLVDGSSVGVNLGEVTSAQGLMLYKRRKRGKMINPGEKTKCDFDDKIKNGDGSASDHDVCMSSSYPIGPSECSFRFCRKIVLERMYQSLSGHEDGIGECIQKALATFSESGRTSEVNESLDSVQGSDNQTHDSAKEPSHAMFSGLSNQLESSTVSETCGRGFFDILISDKFSELCALLLKNFGADNVNRILDVNAINMNMKSGAYETSPILYLEDIQQVWTKLQQVGNEMVMLAKALSDKSKAHYEEFVGPTNACNCNGCGEKADVSNSLVCDSCEKMYHLSCSDIDGIEPPPKTWYCATCISNGTGSPHDDCIVCEKLKKSTSIPMTHETSDGGQGSNICFICKSEVILGDDFRTCGHSLCSHKVYHYKCLSAKQLWVCGPCWYCPSCLCRHCLVDKDDHQIVLCDGCDEAYHIYCMSPPLDSIPKGRWFCANCNMKQVNMMKVVYENMQKKVKVEENAAATGSPMVDGYHDASKPGGLEMLVTAAVCSQNASHQETKMMD